MKWDFSGFVGNGLYCDAVRKWRRRLSGMLNLSFFVESGEQKVRLNYDEKMYGIYM